jgi:hypothetical protein
MNHATHMCSASTCPHHKHVAPTNPSTVPQRTVSPTAYDTRWHPNTPHRHPNTPHRHPNTPHRHPNTLHTDPNTTRVCGPAYGPRRLRQAGSHATAETWSPTQRAQSARGRGRGKQAQRVPLPEASPERLRLVAAGCAGRLTRRMCGMHGITHRICLRAVSTHNGW